MTTPDAPTPVSTPAVPPVSSATAAVGGAQPPASRATRYRRIIRMTLFAATLVVLVDAVVGDKGLLSLLEAKREHAAAMRALERARTENDALRTLARRLREDPSAIEAVARRDLGLIKPGEKVFIVKDVEPAR